MLDCLVSFDQLISKGCAMRAYVLMINHMQLLMTPRESGQVARVIQVLGRCHVRYVNDRYRHTGTLWKRRYKSSLVDCDTHLCRYRYIELNPVRARMCTDPADYP